MKVRFVIALLAVATFCASALAQENAAEDWYKKGRDLSRNGSYEEAVLAYDRAIELEPNNATLYIAKVPSLIILSFITNNQSKRNESMEIIDKALKLDPKNPRARELKGSVLSQMKRYNESLEAYDKAIENISSYKQDIHANQTEFLSYIWTSKSISLWQLMRYNESLEAVDKAVKIDPAGNYDAWAFEGELLAYLGRYNESLQAFDGAAATETAKSQPEIKALPWAKEGYVLIQMGRYEDADSIYQKIIELNFSDESAGNYLTAAWRGRGNALAKLGKYNESLQAFDKAIELNAENAPYAWTGKGDAFRDAGRYDEALKAYDESLKLYPEYADAGIARAWKGKGDVLIKTDRFDEALAAYNKAMVAYDDASMAFNNATPLDRAVSFTFDPYPLDGEFWYGRGIALWSLDRDSEANSAFEKARSLGYRAPTYASPTDLLSITNVTSLVTDEFIELTYTGKETQSFKNLHLISENESIVLPDFTLESGEKIRIHIGPGATNRTDLFLDSEIALDDVSGSLTLKDLVTGAEKFMSYWTPGLAEEDTANYWFKKSGEHLENRSIEEADLALGKALQLDSKNVSIWLGKALTLELLGKGNESQEAFQKSLNLADEDLKKNPQDADSWWSRGVALDALHRQSEATMAREKAVAIYNQTLAENPQDSDTWFKIAEVLVSLSREEEAVSAYRKSAELNGSKKADAWLTAGHLLEMLGRHNESIEAFDQALESIPSNDIRKQAFVWEVKAISLEDANQREEALQAYERITELDPQDTQAWLRQAKLLRDQKRYNQSLEAYEMVLELQPQFIEEVRAWMGKGDILNETGKRDDAMAAYSRALEIEDRKLQENPEDYIAWLDKGRILYKMGRYEEAIEAYNRSTEFSPESMGIPEQAWFGKGEAYLKLDRNEAALEAFKQAIELFPLDYDAWHGKGLALQAMGKRIEAGMAFDVAKKLGYME